MSKNRYTVMVGADVEVQVSDIFADLDYDDIIAHLDLDEFLGQLDEKILIEHLKQYGYSVEKIDEE